MAPKTVKTQSMEAMLQQLSVKEKMLVSFQAQTKTAISDKNERKMTRVRDQLQIKLDSCYEIITDVTEMKLADDQDGNTVQSWATGKEQQLQVYEDLLTEIDNYFKELALEEKKNEKKEMMRLEEEKRRQEDARERERFERQKDFELELEEKRLQRVREERQRAKLPKLEISKFDGTSLDWTRIWEEFEEEIDKCTNYAPITKFSYLKELLQNKPKSEISGLPSTEEGYEKAKELLKAKYGVTSEIIQAHGKAILNLPIIQRENDFKAIHHFYRKLNISINSLRTLNKLDTAEILVRETLDKLGPIKADLIRTAPNWQDWKFEDLLTALREFTIRNPEVDEKYRRNSLSERTLSSKVRHFEAHNTRETQKKPTCIFCKSEEHRSSECHKLKSIKERKEFLKTNKLCYNCGGKNHVVTQCRSRNCSKCNQRHHTAICHLREESPSLLMCEDNKETIHPTVVAMAKNQNFRILLDTGAGSSFVSATLINHLDIKPTYWETKSIETISSTVNQKLPVYNFQITSTDSKFTLDITANKLDRSVLTTLTNPNIKNLKKNYPHLQGIPFDNEDSKPDHPIHLILGAGDISRIKSTGVIIGRPGEPIAEQTLLGWTVMGPGNIASSISLFTRTSDEDYHQLYSLDVLGLEDRHEGDQDNVYDEFKEQLQRQHDGSYSTRLPWRPNHQPLKSNSAPSFARLQNLLNRLKNKPDILQEYHNIIQGQLADGILEDAPTQPTGEKIFYMPHRPVIRENAETTKLRIVYDASARENSQALSLNDCLHVGPSLQPLLQNVLIRNRLKPIALMGDIKQAFLQIGIHEQDRDALRFYWVKDLKTLEVTTLRFARLPFGCASSPFILGGTLREHLSTYSLDNPTHKDIICEIQKDLFVDDLISGGETISDVKELKETANNVFKEGGFQLHKWHSNLETLEEEDESADTCANDLETYAKERVGTTTKETKILGVPWNKDEDNIAVKFVTCSTSPEITKRSMLRSLATIYDPLGIASPITLVGKMLYREACELKVPWDKPLETLARKWSSWIDSLPPTVSIRRSIPIAYQKITSVELHGFGDASKQGCCSTIYAIVHQDQSVSKGILTAKSRIAKRDLSIPRLELIAGHMVANSLMNVCQALSGYPISGTYGWLDSTVALYWIQSNQNEWKQFVSNRVSKIQEKKDIQWRHCPGTCNPADIGSRGVASLPSRWVTGPEWLDDKSQWPENITSLHPSKEVNEERKKAKELHLSVRTTNSCDVFSTILGKYKLTKVLRITAWVRRYINNIRSKTSKMKGGLTSVEINDSLDFWIKKTQLGGTSMEKHDEISTRLQLENNNDNILICKGRILGEHPIYLPSPHPFTSKIIEDAHMKTHHGLIGLTMAKVREKYWVEKLRSQVKSIIHHCPLCRRYHGKPYPRPPTATLPSFRTQATRAFQNIGLDFAGPLEYKISNGHYGKAYIALYTCATSRSVHLDLIKNMETGTFKRSLKEFIARRGSPDIIVSDNAKTFQSTARWIKSLQKNSDIHMTLSESKTEWKFNLSRSPWWGGFFERMVGLTKSVLYKRLTKSRLSFESLKELIVDCEVVLNNRPLTYLEDDIQLSPLTPNMLIHGTNITVLENQFIDDAEILKPTRLAKHLHKCKEALWKRWQSEYLRSLREKHNNSRGKKTDIQIGEIVIIKDFHQKNKGLWKTAVITGLIQKDNVTLGAKLKTGTNILLERPIEMLYPLELRNESTTIPVSADTSAATPAFDKEISTTPSSDDVATDTPTFNETTATTPVSDNLSTTTSASNGVPSSIQQGRPKRDAKDLALARILAVNDE